MSGAFEEALRRWPEVGVPTNPEGWLLTVARNRQRDVWRSAATRRSVPLPDHGDAVDLFADLDALAIGGRAADLAPDPAVADFLRRRGEARTGIGPLSRHRTERT